MKIKNYLIYTFLFIVLVWVWVFSLVPGNYNFSIFGFECELSIATWFILPLVTFGLLSVFHMSYYGIKNFLDARAVKKDLELYTNLAKEVYLGLDSNKDFKTDLFVLPSKIVKSLSFWTKPEIDFRNEELNNIYAISKAIKNGDFQDIKRYKLTKTNPLFLQNEKNHILNDYTYAMEILDSKTEQDENLKKLAKEILIQKASYNELVKYNFNFENNEVLILVDRYINNDNFELNGNELFDLLKNNHLEAEQYIKLAINLKSKLDPNQLISIFEQFKNEHSNAMEAYLYVLYDLQMLDKLRDIINSNERNDFERIKILLFLRENGKVVDASLFYK